MGCSSTSWPTTRGKTSAPLELATRKADPILAVTFILRSTQRNPVANIDAMPMPSSAVPT